ncbi:MAG: hypothetical protein ACQEQE_08595 [Bacillota bacterium]
MKKLFIIVLIFIILLSGCQEKELSNIIEKSDLTKEDKKILKIEKIHKNSSVFDYKFDKKYKSVEIWLEVYEKGKIIKQRNRAFSNIKDNDGQIFIGVDYDDKYNWLISHQNSEDVMKYSFKTDDKFLKNTSYKKEFYLLKREKIKENSPILLKAYLFSNGNINLSNKDKLKNNLEKFDYAYLIKIKFN